MLDLDWYKNANTRAVFIHCLLKAVCEPQDWNGVLLQRGQLITTVKELSDELCLTEKQVRLSIEKLTKGKQIGKQRANKYSIITVCEYDSYSCPEDDQGQTKGNQKGKQKNQGKQKGNQKGKQESFVNACNIEEYEQGKNVEGNQKGKQKVNQEEIKKEENTSPITPLKEEINKEDVTFLSEREPIVNDRLLPAHTHEGEQGKPKRKTRAKENEEYTLIHKARLVVEGFFRDMYGDEYYWQPKDAFNMKQLLQKFSYSRRNRPAPLPVDDDSLVDALTQFLPRIEKRWIVNNFSVAQINAHYNEIVSEIQRNNNGQNRINTPDGGQAAASARQKASVLSAVEEAQRRWEEQKRLGQG